MVEAGESLRVMEGGIQQLMSRDVVLQQVTTNEAGERCCGGDLFRAEEELRRRELDRAAQRTMFASNAPTVDGSSVGDEAARTIPYAMDLRGTDSTADASDANLNVALVERQNENLLVLGEAKKFELAEGEGHERVKALEQQLVKHHESQVSGTSRGLAQQKAQIEIVDLECALTGWKGDQGGGGGGESRCSLMEKISSVGAF